ncbi:MAG TPA: hypothetical protein VID27_18575 [Blastocatellia bacterium]
MKTQNEKDELFVRYLLGQLSEEEQQQVERRYFGDDDFYEQLEAVEDDLVDAYVRGRLSPPERQQFEQHFLPFEDRREKVEFARQWRTFVAGNRAKPAEKAKPRWLNFFHSRLVLIPLAASLVLALGAGLLAFQLARLNRQIERMREERGAQEKTAQELHEQVADEQRRSQQLLEELQNERSKREVKDRPSPSLPVIASFLLSPGLSRGAGEGGKFAVPVEATEVRLQVLFKVGDYSVYAAEVETVEGRRVWSQRALKARARGEDRSVIVTVPARLLRDEDYILTLKGITPAGEMKDVSEYSFRIVR